MNSMQRSQLSVKDSLCFACLFFSQSISIMPGWGTCACIWPCLVRVSDPVWSGYLMLCDLDSWPCLVWVPGPFWSGYPALSGLGIWSYLVWVKVQPMSVLPADPMADVFFLTSADVRSDLMFSVDINNALKNANLCWHTIECSHFHRRVPMRGDFRRVEMFGFSRQEISGPILPSFPFQSTQIFPSNVLFKL